MEAIAQLVSGCGVSPQNMRRDALPTEFAQDCTLASVTQLNKEYTNMEAIAQLVERRIVVPDVAGSSPVSLPYNFILLMVYGVIGNR